MPSHSMPAMVQANPSPVVAPSGLPLVTTILLGVMIILFAGEIKFGVGPQSGTLSPGIRTLIAFGGLQHQLVIGEGQWYRLVSAPMLHLSATHLVLNGVGLYLAGRVLEPVVGRLGFAALFAIGGLAGGLMSLVVNAHNVVAVGASGAIMALFAAMLVVGLRAPAEVAKLRMLTTAICVLIPSLLPLARAATGASVDYGAHIGGAIAGAIAGLLLLRTNEDFDRPRLEAIAGTITVVSIAAVLWSGIANAQRYHIYLLANHLIPEAELKASMDELVGRAPSLIRTYPHDPRSHMYAAIADLRANNFHNAEKELRAALAEEDMLQLLKPSFKTHLEATLALVLSNERRSDDARNMARSGCADATAALHVNLLKAGLCVDQKS